MSTITLDDVKAALKIDGDAADAALQQALDGAIEACKRYCDRSELPTLPLDYPAEGSSEPGESSEDPVAPDVKLGILVMVKGLYFGGVAEQVDYRRAAEMYWTPYRRGWGV